MCDSALCGGLRISADTRSGSGQVSPSARAQVVWHWFGGCAGTDSLVLEFHVDGKMVYSATFPVCQMRRADIRPEPQQRVLTFHFDAAPHRSVVSIERLSPSR